jgi:hypothetical protein
MAPGALLAEWLPPFETKGLTEADLESLKRKVREEMERVLMNSARN